MEFARWKHTPKKYCYNTWYVFFWLASDLLADIYKSNSYNIKELYLFIEDSYRSYIYYS